MNKLYQLINCREDRVKNCNYILNKNCPGTCEYYKFMSGYYMPKNVGWCLEEMIDNWKKILK
jgi:hypothetical protein